MRQDINLNHGFYSVHYFPENDQIGHTVSEEARNEAINAFFNLNHQRLEEEDTKGSRKKKDVEAYFRQKSKEVPDEIAIHFSKKKTKNTNKVEELSGTYKSEFGDETVVTENCRVQIKNSSKKKYYYHLTSKAVKGEFTVDYKQIKPDSALAETMIGKSDGDKFEFGDMEYKVIKIEQ